MDVFMDARRSDMRRNQYRSDCEMLLWHCMMADEQNG